MEKSDVIKEVVQSEPKKQIEQLSEGLIKSGNKDEIKEEITGDADNENLQSSSEKAYIRITEKIVETTTNQLKEERNNKKDLRRILLNFFIFLLSLQYIGMIFLVAFGIQHITVVITYMTSVFVETLGAVYIMVKFAFDSKTEVQGLKIMTEVVSRFKKYRKNEKERMEDNE